MFLTKSKLVLVMLTLLILVGQVVSTSAYAASCSMDTQSQSMMMTMEHAMDTEMATTEFSSAVTDCCETGSDCSMNGCISFFAAPISFQNSMIFSTSESVESLMQAAVISFAVSLYRPPILG